MVYNYLNFIKKYLLIHLVFTFTVHLNSDIKLALDLLDMHFYFIKTYT